MYLSALHKRWSLKKVQDLIVEIRTLELTHKQSQERSTLQALMSARSSPLEELGKTQKAGSYSMSHTVSCSMIKKQQVG